MFRNRRECVLVFIVVCCLFAGCSEPAKTEKKTQPEEGKPLEPRPSPVFAAFLEQQLAAEIAERSKLEARLAQLEVEHKLLTRDQEAQANREARLVRLEEQLKRTSAEASERAQDNANLKRAIEEFTKESGKIAIAIQRLESRIESLTRLPIVKDIAPPKFVPDPTRPSGASPEDEKDARASLERAKFFDRGFDFDPTYREVYREKLENVIKSFPATKAAVEAAKLIRGLGDSKNSGRKAESETARPREIERESAPPRAAKDESEIKRSKSKTPASRLVLRMESKIGRELIHVDLADWPLGSFSESNTELSIGVVSGVHIITAKLRDQGWPPENFWWRRTVTVGPGEIVELTLRWDAFERDPGYPASWRR